MSNPGGLDFNITPYYDDFDEDKKFVRMLFRPGRAVQARELSQLQTLFQKQIERFGNYFFKEGAIIDGCEQGLDLNLPYIKLQTNYNSAEVNVSSFLNKDIVGSKSGVRARVGIVADIESTDPKTLFINYIASGTGVLSVNAIPTTLVIGNSIGNANASATIEYWDSTLLKIYVSNANGSYDLLASTLGTVSTLDANTAQVFMALTAVSDSRSIKEFQDDETLFTLTGSRVYATSALTSANSHVENDVTYTRGSKVTVGDGIIYVADHFVKNSNQTVILDKYKNIPSYRIGVVPSKEIVDYIIDGSLVDNAQGTPNYQAPGADRFKLDTTLTKIALNAETAETEFITLLEVEDGVIKKRKSFGIENKIEDVISKRTFEESGDYTLSNPKINVREHLIQGNNGGRYASTAGGDTNLLLVEVDPFIAYVKGFRNEFISKQSIELNKGLDVQYVEQNKTQINYGNYVEVNELVGSWDLMEATPVDLYSVAFQAVTNRTFASTSANTAYKIGTARVRSIDYTSGVPGTPSSVHNLYLFDVVMNSANSFSSVRSIYDSSTVNRFADVVLNEQGSATLKETSFNNVIFQLPYEAIRTIRSVDNNIESGFTFKKEFSVSFSTTGVATISTGDNNETFVGTGVLSDTQKNENYIVIPDTTVICDAISGTIVVANNSVSVTGTSTAFQSKLNIGDHIRFGANTDIYRVATITSDTILTLSSAHNGGSTSAISKVLPAGVPIRLTGKGSSTIGGERAVTVTIPGSTSITIELKENTATSYSAKFISTLNRSNAREMKKVLYANTNVYIQANTHPTTLSGPYSLGKSDVYQIRGIYQSSSFTAVPTTANTNVTANYIFNNGQRDNTYEHATITPKLGVTPTGRLLVVFDYFTHDTSQGISYLSVDSYPIDDVNDTSTTINTADIPVYISTTTGAAYSLRNCLDFRLRKLDDTINTINPVDAGVYQIPVGGLHIPKPFSDFDSSLSLYKGRISRLFLNDQGEFGISDGSPGYPTPQVPPSIPGTLDLAIITVPAYPSEPKNIIIEPQKNRRYTMRDIGKIEDRVNRLEYYTSLNLLEKQAADVSILDDNGLDRFKNGILVDPFIGYNVADVNSNDLVTSISRKEKFATAQIELKDIALEFDSTTSSNVVRTEGNKLVLAYTHELFSSNPYASSVLNLTQDLTYDWTGVATVYPSTDNWMETTNYPGRNLVVDIEGNSDNWRQISNAWETEFDAWETRWVGVPVQQESIQSRGVVGRIFDSSSALQYDAISSNITLGPTEIQSQARVVDVSVNHYMRSRDYLFSVSGLKPFSKLYAFMDGVNVTLNCRAITLQSGKDINDAFDVIGYDGFLAVANTVYVSANTVGELFANKNGEITGYYRLPEQTFNVGQREFKLADDSENRDAFITSSAKALIVSQGISLISKGTQINTRPSNINFASNIEKTSVSKQAKIAGAAARNPLTQSFFVDDVTYPYGVFVSKIDVYFKTKSSNVESKVYMQIREMENGLPTRKAIGDSTTYVKSSAITTSLTGTSATTFTFGNPIFLLPGNEYCFSILPEGNKDEFEVWIAELGQLDVSGPFNQQRIEKQPAAGTLFTSSNDYTWSVRQIQDLKYDIYVATFTPNTHGYAYLQNKNQLADFDYSGLIVNLGKINPDKTNMVIDVQVTDSAALTSGYFNVDNLELIKLTDRKSIIDSAQEVSNGVKSVKIKADFTTDNKYITPVIDLERTQTIVYDYKINSSTYTLLSGDATFTTGANTVVGYNTGFTTEISNGQFISFGGVNRQVKSITNNAHLIVATNFVTSSSNVAITSLNEENPIGTYASQSRYITRRVELADGFEANDLNVYIDVNRPAGTDIRVYYKVLNNSDNDSFDNKFYQEMTIEGSTVFNEDPDTYSSEKYVVSPAIKSGGSNVLSGTVATSNASVTVTGTSTRFLEQLNIGDTVRVNSDTRVVSTIANNTSLTVDSNFSTIQSGTQMYKMLYNTIVYTTPDNRTYSGYKYFAVKVVFLSNNPAISPKIKKLKAIALT